MMYIMLCMVCMLLVIPKAPIVEILYHFMNEELNLIWVSRLS